MIYLIMAYPLGMILTLIPILLYIAFDSVRGFDVETPTLFDVLILSALWPFTLPIMTGLIVSTVLRKKTPEEIHALHIKKLKRKPMNVEAAIVVEDEDKLVTGRPLQFPNLKNWKASRDLVQNIIDDPDACFAIHAHSHGYLPDDTVMTVYALQFVYRSDNTGEVLSVETYEKHQGPNTFLNRTWAE
jgi:hypothetical protein